jgi:hypothetical protein
MAMSSCITQLRYRFAIAGLFVSMVGFPIRAEETPVPAPAAEAGPSTEKAPTEPNAAEPNATEPAATQPPAADKVHLQFKFKTGQVVRYEVVHEMEITTLFNGAKEIAKNKSNTARSYKVGPVTTEGDGDLQLTIDRVHMFALFDTGDAVTTPIEFQSDDPAKHPKEFRPILEVVGKPTATIRFDRSGRIVSVDESKINRPKSAAGVVKKAGGAPLNPLHTGLADATPESYLVALPEEPVAPGNTWKERFEVVARDDQNLPIRIMMQRNYKLASVQDGKASIEFRTFTLSPNLEAAVEAQLIQRETSGKIVFDIERGLIISHDSHVERSVVQPFGPKSRMDAKSKYHEKLVTEELAVARKSDDAAETSK